MAAQMSARASRRLRPRHTALVSMLWAGAGCGAELSGPPPLAELEAVLLGTHAIEPDISGPRVVWREPSAGLAPDTFVVHHMETGERVRIPGLGVSAGGPAIDGTTVVWDDFDGEVSRVAVADVSGGPATLLGEGLAPDVSGQHVVWLRHVERERRVVLHDLDAGRETELGTGYFATNEPRVDGGRVVWSAFPVPRTGSTSESAVVLVHDAAAGTTEVVAPEEGAYLQPDISGDRIVWTHGVPLAGDPERNRTDIVLFDLGTRQLRKLTDDEAGQGLPAIDDDLVVWRQVVGPARGDGPLDIPTELFVHDLAADRTRQLTGRRHDPRPFARPGLSGRRVVWQESPESSRFPTFSVVLLEIP